MVYREVMGYCEVITGAAQKLAPKVLKLAEVLEVARGARPRGSEFESLDNGVIVVVTMALRR